MNSQPDQSTQPRRLWWSIFLPPLAAVLVAGGYLLASGLVHGIGFPLDDAWIHQTYARNLALLGQWSFIPGEPSAGSTSPAWSLLLAVGYLVKAGPFLWTFLLGAACLAFLGFTGEKWAQAAGSQPPLHLPLFALLLIGEWHLAWAAVSGMETILFALLILAVFYFLAKGGKEWLVGLLIGASIWVRPDGITLLGPAVLVYFFASAAWKSRLVKILRVVLPVLALGTAYMLFNFAVSHTWLPNTFFAKQAEYAIYQQIPLVSRFSSLASLALVGPGLLLLPGFGYFAWQAFRQRSWAALSMLLWWLGYILIYAVRLPVTYQHGRYIIPSMPVYFVTGLLGTLELLRKLKNGPAALPERTRRLRRLGAFGASTLIAAVCLGMLVIDAVSYAQEVAIIDTEMVSTARWVAANTPPDAVVGAHDIGALGYFGSRKILDLAGLVSPEVIPFIRDEPALANYLTQNHASLLMTFPAWYPQLVKGRSILYQSGGTFSPAAGGENMVIYRWP